MTKVSSITNAWDLIASDLGWSSYNDYTIENGKMVFRNPENPSEYIVKNDDNLTAYTASGVEVYSWIW